MIEFYNEDKKNIVKFAGYGKIVMQDDNFSVDGSATALGAQFAKYIYNYFHPAATLSQTHLEIFDGKGELRIITIGKKLSSTYRTPKDQKHTIEVSWDGQESEDWIIFKSAFDRYFSLTAFL